MVDEWETVQCGSPANGAMKILSVEKEAITGESFCYDSLVRVNDTIKGRWNEAGSK